MKSTTVVATPNGRRLHATTLSSDAVRLPVAISRRSLARAAVSRMPFVLASAIILFASVWLAPKNVAFDGFDATKIFNLLALLFVIALLAERALEVFVGTWRSPGATQLGLVVKTCRQHVARVEQGPQPDETAIRQARAALEGAQRDELRYRCVTRQIALWTGLALGLMVGAVGVRALGSLVTFHEFSKGQEVAFRLVDGLLTGGVIAGGSEGVHRVFTVFENFMNTAAKRSKAVAA